MDNLIRNVISKEAGSTYQPPKALSKKTIDRNTNHLHTLLHTGRRYRISKKQTMQSSDDRYRPLINLVAEGYIKRYEINSDGSLATQAVYGPGDVFPLTLMFKSLFDQDVYDGPEVIYYETVTDAVVYSLEAELVTEAVKKNPVLYRDFLLEAGVRTHSNIQRLENLALKSALKRIAHQLSFLAKQFGESKASGIKIKVSLTHQDLADILSLTRETVSVNLRQLQKMNLIKYGRNIEVSDLEKLNHVAYS